MSYFLEEFMKNLNGLINAYRILLAIEEGRERVELIKIENEKDEVNERGDVNG